MSDLDEQKPTSSNTATQPDIEFALWESASIESWLKEDPDLETEKTKI